MTGVDVAALRRLHYEYQRGGVASDYYNALAEAAPVLFDVYEALARARVVCPIHGIPDCSPLLNGCSIPRHIHAWRAAVIKAKP